MMSPSYGSHQKLVFFDNTKRICYINIAFERENNMLNNQLTTTTKTTTLKSISYIGCFSIV